MALVRRGAGWKCSRFIQRMVTMTTLILLCLALIGAGVFLFAPQAWVRGETSMLKILPAIAVIVLLASGCAGIAKSTKSIPAHESIPAHKPLLLIADLHDNEVLSDYRKQGDNLGAWLIRHCTTHKSGFGISVNLGFDKHEYEGGAYKARLLQKGQCPRAFANYKAAREKLWKHEEEEKKKREERLAKQEKEEEERRAKKAAEIRRAVAEFNKAVDDLWSALQEKKNYCEVLLHGTVILGEIEEHNERGVGAVAKEFRIPDGKLRGILEVARRGCNPE